MAASFSPCRRTGNVLLLVDPSQTTVEDTMFLDTQAVVRAGPRGRLTGVVFRENVYAFNDAVAWGVNRSIVLDGEFAACSGVVIEDEVNGLFLHDETVRGTADALTRLVADAGLRERLGRAALQRAHEHFDIRVTARRTADVHTAVLAD